MITIHGDANSDEYKHAERLRDVIQQHWPHAAEAPPEKSTIVIIAGAKCYGQRVVDIDLVVLINNYDWRHYPTPAIDSIPDKTVYVHSLCLVVEIKQHQPDQVIFEGNRVAVTYRRENQTHDVSGQSHQQKFALIDYIKEHGLKPPYVTNLIWLSNVPTAMLPPNINNIVGSDATWEGWLRCVQHNQQPFLFTYAKPHGYQLRAGGQDVTNQMERVITLLNKRIEASPLDRKRVERIVKGAIQGEATIYTHKLGEQLLVFRGRGGTGKTMRLLQLAYKLYHERGARVLILSYNHTLISDIRRTFSIMNISDPLEDRSIVVKTVHSLMGSLLSHLEITKPNESDRQFYQNYPDYVRELQRMLEAQAITRTDLDELIRSRPELFDWDILCIDEAQDWLTAERDVFYQIYGPQRIIIADGIDQFVRSSQKTNWIERVPASNRQIVTLHKALRLKAGLCAFVQAIAYEVQLDDWQIEPDSSIYGGRIIILEGPIHHLPRPLFDAVLAHHTKAGNRHVDLLWCVPPSLARTGDTSQVAQLLQTWGYGSWDATNDYTRGIPPLSADDFRIVQYDSCRGLEGWTVANLAMDELYDYKHTQYQAAKGTLDLADDPEERHRYAARWLMIPLTRAMDTLVIHISDPQHEVARIVRAAAATCGDAVDLQWHTLPLAPE